MPIYSIGIDVGPIEIMGMILIGVPPSSACMQRAGKPATHVTPTILKVVRVNIGRGPLLVNPLPSPRPSLPSRARVVLPARARGILLHAQ